MFDILQFLVPLAVAAIVFLINAAGKKGENKNDPRRTQPPVKNWKEKPSHNSRQPQQRQQTKAQELVRAEQKANDLRNQAKEVIEQVVEVRSASSDRQQKIDQPISKPITLKQPTSRQLAEQVIWSEILGEPRAKKPHRIFSNKRVH
ncbi:hypothetical protein SAMN05421663_107207 [Terribacillus halophilus]|uniref:Uncharacterized protein n=1 Tax=Terribacillus halophilus TaxID=361279 RepID=A0A1G6SQK1_9BACI|nr:hypothetical protein [Terribacillus halophilus]SDD19170.1 hypothetical protein SAMN05421663_107207 [Terribacillus halophilus]